jgi:hypothetical protein
MNGIHSTSVFFSASRFGANVICILLTLTLLSDLFGFLPSSTFHLLAIYLIIGVTILNLPLRKTGITLITENLDQKKLAGGILIWLGGFFLLLLTETQLLWVSSIPLLLAGLDISLRALHHKRREIGILTVSSFSYGLVFLLLQTVPPIWWFFQQSSLLFSNAISTLTGSPVTLGPTASGLGILLIFFVLQLTVSMFIRPKKIKELLWFVISLLMLLLIWVCYILLLSRMAYSSTEVFTLLPVLFLFYLVPVFILFLKYSKMEYGPNKQIPRSRRFGVILKNMQVWAALLLMISIAFLTLFINAGSSSDESHTIVFYGNNMVGTWDIPEYGKYGKDAVGMFGLWPVYLTSLGYTTELLIQNTTNIFQSSSSFDHNITHYLNLTDYTTIIESEEITQEILANTDVFVITNLNSSFSEEEHLLLWEFVDNGGSLLVIGDHTNVGGMQQPLNALLSPVGIRYRFDAALPVDDTLKWLTSTNMMYHPLNEPFISPYQLQYGVGASLDVSYPAFPLIIGTTALSDNGNQSNSDIAYLGDYDYNKGEQLGDVILVAAAYYGQGKVLVFGDTSTFQNPAVPFSAPFLQSTFTWLTNTQTPLLVMIQRDVSVLLLITAVLLIVLSKRNTVPYAVFPLLMCLSLLVSISLNPLILTADEGYATNNIVFLDTSHGERLSLESFTDDSLNGLFVNLQRNNYLPFVLQEFSKAKIRQSQLFICVAPTQAFTAEDVRFLEEYMDGGGVVILATGYEDKDASQPLLEAFDIDIEPTPLGPVPYVEENLTLYQNEPRFVDSWPVVFEDNQIRSYYNFTWENFTFHLVVFAPHGAGGLLVIGDSQYLLDKNIESIYDYWPGNILFLKYLLEELPLRGGSK